MSLLTYLSDYDGTLNDKTMSWLRTWSPWMSEGTMDDLWMAFLQKYPGSLNDKMLAWARVTTGLSGAALNDALEALPADGAVYGGASLGLYFTEDEYERGAIGTIPADETFSNVITFTRASGGGRFNASGVYEWLGNDVPRLDYDPVTLAPRGILIEEQRTNLLTYSEQFDNAAWQKLAVSLEAADADAYKVTTTSVSSSHQVGQVASPVAGTYTVSVDIKRDDCPYLAIYPINQSAAFADNENRHAMIDLATMTVFSTSGAGVVVTIKPVDDGFHRVSRFAAFEFIFRHEVIQLDTVAVNH